MDVPIETQVHSLPMKILTREEVQGTRWRGAEHKVKRCRGQGEGCRGQSKLFRQFMWTIWWKCLVKSMVLLTHPESAEACWDTEEDPEQLLYRQHVQIRQRFRLFSSLSDARGLRRLRSSMRRCVRVRQSRNYLDKCVGRITTVGKTARAHASTLLVSYLCWTGAFAHSLHLLLFCCAPQYEFFQLDRLFVSCSHCCMVCLCAYVGAPKRSACWVSYLFVCVLAWVNMFTFVLHEFHLPLLLCKFVL